MGKHGTSSPTDSITAATTAMNVASIERIPASELPDPAARAALIDLAKLGVEVYAYTSGPSQRTTIWLRPFTADIDGRMTCADWLRIYTQEVTEEALANLRPKLENAQGTFTLFQVAFEHSSTAGIREFLEMAYQTRKELEQRIRLIRWRLKTSGCAA